MHARSLVSGFGVGAVAALAVGVAVASIPDSSGVIHACYQRVDAATKPVKLLDTGQSTKCASTTVQGVGVDVVGVP